MTSGKRKNVNLQPRDSRGRFAKEEIRLRPIKVKKVKGTIGTYKVVERKLSDQTIDESIGLVSVSILIFVTWNFSKLYYLYIA
ncbi:hypothetical protein [Metabacillus sp. 22489]|uniref:hypothetical protein n=1 Tax=Metabacillus sp. 22489 TaxID=3453928 RepID=UPI003F862502